MSSWSQITFAQPWWLLLLALLPLLAWWLHRTRYRYFASLRLPALDGLHRAASWRSRTVWVPWALRALAAALLIVALARPRLELKEEKVKAEGIDIMLAMDLSSSMLARDFKPDRLEVSKRVAAEFVDKRPYDRIGIVAFAGEAFLQCPLTTDHRVVKEFLEALECGMLEDGTAIGMGLATAVNHLKDSKAKSKVIILLTDGVNNAGYIQPDMAAAIAKEFGIRVYTIGVGSQGEAITPVSRRSDGTYIFGLARVEIDEELLRRIARQTGGRYFRATSAEALERVYEEIDRLEKTEIEVTTLRRYDEMFYSFAGLALALLVLELLLGHTLWKGGP